ncbi:MAG TPA: pyridoxamine 5'-phosphate oxidase family protein [Candidatus Saccharimonadales bacterium]|jgi:general stress protein 26|nr:pyridoxamine 5'-phosphate oxidase family protein [Candidatus Saccharimonadales bacterium]
MTETVKILNFLRTQTMATISTIALGSLQPESALIAFTQTDDLEIIFESFVNTRKWKNLQHNPRAALVIGWDTKNHITVQYEGVATAVPDSETERYIQLFLAKDTPCTEIFLRDPRVRLFKVVPQWIRYSDYTDQHPKVIEESYIEPAS